MTQRSRRRRRRLRDSGRKKLLLAVGFPLALVGIAAIGAAAWVIDVYNSAPSLASLRPITKGAVSKVYAADGSLKKSTLTSPGRLTEELTFNPDGTTRKESQVPDEIDAHGNWIKQTTWVTDARGTQPVKVTYRVITYY